MESDPVPGVEATPPLDTRAALRAVRAVPGRLEARHRALQAEMAGLAVLAESRYPPWEMVRHALEGGIKSHDAVILARLVQELAPARILEVGSFLGFSTRWLLEASRDFGSAVVSIDPDIRHRVYDRPTETLLRFNADFLDSRLTVRRGFFSERMSGGWYFDFEHYEPFVSRADVDALFYKIPLLTAENLGEGTFDFIFLDGDHSRKGVLINFAEALRLLNPGGCIALHDVLTWPTSGEALAYIAERYAGLGDVEIHGWGLPAGLCDGVGVFRLRGDRA
jgi:predicted O-methyltransferase YrrM